MAKVATLKNIEEVMGSQYAENATKPASVNQMYFLGSLFGQVWLENAGKSVNDFKWQARKIFGSIIQKVYSTRKNPLTQFDIAKAKQDFDAGKLKIPATILNKVQINPEELTTSRKSKPAKESSEQVDKLLAVIEAQNEQMQQLQAKVDQLYVDPATTN